jgi:hypothetical protein
MRFAGNGAIGLLLIIIPYQLVASKETRPELIANPIAIAPLCQINVEMISMVFVRSRPQNGCETDTCIAPYPLQEYGLIGELELGFKAGPFAFDAHQRAITELQGRDIKRIGFAMLAQFSIGRTVAVAASIVGCGVDLHQLLAQIT